MPCISTVAPVAAVVLRPQAASPQTRPFKWTYHFFWGLEDIIAVFLDMWGQVETNKIVGALWPNDGDGNAWGDPELGFPPRARAGRLHAGRSRGATRTCTTISARRSRRSRRQDVEIITGVPIPPDFTNFWTQAAQQGFHPKIASVGKALLFPASVDALGDLGEGMSTEVWWTPDPPVQLVTHRRDRQRSSADGYTTATAKQWTQPIGFAHALFEVAADVLQPGRERRRQGGHPRRHQGDEPRHDRRARSSGRGGPTPNVAKTPLVGGQWRKRHGLQYDLVIVSNEGQPDIPIAGELKPIPS